MTPTAPRILRSVQTLPDADALAAMTDADLAEWLAVGVRDFAAFRERAVAESRRRQAR